MFSEKLKAFRAKTKLSQRKLAEVLGIPRRTYENWESNINVPAQYMQESILEKIKKISEDVKNG